MHAEILRISEVLTQVESLVSFAAMFVWLIVFYILYQQTKLKFILWLIWGEILGIVAVAAIFIASKYLFAAISEGAKALFSQGIIQLSASRLLSLIAVVVSTIGAILALRYLRVCFRRDLPG
jgi:hypothetical protein